MYSKKFIQSAAAQYRVLCTARAELLKREGYSAAYWAARNEEIFFYEKHGAAIRRAG